MPRSVRFAIGLGLFISTLPGVSVFAQQASASAQEQRAVRAFETARKSPLAIHAFLEKMPKGADLHMHLSGAIYAETFIQDAVADQICINPIKLSLVNKDSSTKFCNEGLIPAATALNNQKLYDDLVDAFSMRSFVPTPGHSGHDQFFETFSHFGGVEKTHRGEWLDEVATRAAAQNEQYLEIMETPTYIGAAKLGARFGWPKTPGTPRPLITQVAIGTTPTELGKLRDQLLAAGLKDEVAVDRREFADALADRNRIERCGQPDAEPACSIQIRFLYQILRANSPQQVFAQTLLGFEVASIDPTVVGINFVEPEDDHLAMSEYHRQMLMLDYLHSVYPKVHISLHAGEVAPGLVAPEGLRFHIREAIDLGHAERIGHGVDVMYEDDPQALLKEMADRHIMAEINLTSNDVILGVKSPMHPLPSYREAHVPVALSTDDEGVSRIDLTNEYTRAALEFGLTYPELKDMARTGLEHSFLAGNSLWQQRDSFTSVVAACAGQAIGADDPNEGCIAFLKASDKAAQQWQLEHRFRVFESTLQ